MFWTHVSFGGVYTLRIPPLRLARRDAVPLPEAFNCSLLLCVGVLAIAID